MNSDLHRYTIRSPGGAGHNFIVQCLIHLHFRDQFNIEIDEDLGHAHLISNKEPLPNGGLFKNLIQWYHTQDDFKDALPNSKLINIEYDTDDIFHIEVKHFFKMARFTTRDLFIDKQRQPHWFFYDQLHESGQIKNTVKSNLDELPLNEKRILIEHLTKIRSQDFVIPNFSDDLKIISINFRNIFTNKKHTLVTLQSITGIPITPSLIQAYDLYLARQPKPWSDVLF